jgi:DNA-binding response OmpR family regulator
LRPHGPRVLVVEDDPRSKEVLADVIQREGWEFHVADTVEEALAAASDLAPEVIVVEPRTERGACATLLEKLRQRGAWSPVLFHTDDLACDAQFALEHGASGVVAKSAGPGVLRDAIAHVLADHRDRKADRSR